MKLYVKNILREEIENVKDRYDRKVISILKKEGFSPIYDYRKVIDFLNRFLAISGLEAFRLYQMFKDNYKSVDTGGKLIRKDISNMRIKTTNSEARELVKAKIPFKASNTDGEYVGNTYVVYSYLWYPIFVYKDGQWFENKDKYSPTTSKQTSQLRPLGEDIIKVNTQELRDLI